MDVPGLILCYWIAAVAFGWMFWVDWLLKRNSGRREIPRPEKVELYTDAEGDSTD